MTLYSESTEGYHYVVTYDYETKLYEGSVREVEGCHALGDNETEVVKNLDLAMVDLKEAYKENGATFPKPLATKSK
jgi:predicted RNase H-like HicB family nuclease